MSVVQTAVGRWSIALLILSTVAIALCAVVTTTGAYEHRKSTPSFGAQFGYGKIVSGESYFVNSWPLSDGRTVPARFNIEDTNSQWGPSAHLGVRFVLDRSHALGFGFDDLRYKRKEGYTADEKEAIPNWVKFTTVHADYYLYFDRRKRVSYYAAPFVGIQQRELRFKGSEVSVQEYKLLYGGTLGVEYFVSRTFSFDIAGRIFALRGGSGTNVLVQPALGIHFYVI